MTIHKPDLPEPQPVRFQPVQFWGAAPASDDRRLTPLQQFEMRYGWFGQREIRDFRGEFEQPQESGAGNGRYTMVGHPIVFDAWSLDLGFFRERVDRHALDSVLENDLDVLHLRDHDPSKVLARTRNRSLELGLTQRGLRMWSRVSSKTTYGNDLLENLMDGLVDGASFAFTVARDEWDITTDADGEEQVRRTILEIDQLFDVTTTAVGAYPQADSQLARSITDYAKHTAAPVALNDPAGDAESRKAGSGSETNKRLAALRARSRRARLLN